MPGAFLATDLAAVFNVDEFATTVQWIGPSGQPSDLVAILDDVAPAVFDDAVIADQPFVLARTADVDGIDAGQVIIHGDEQRRIQSAERIGDGLLTRIEISGPLWTVSG